MDNFAFLLPVMMIIFACVFAELFRRGTHEAGYWAAGYFSAAIAFCVPLGTGLARAELLSVIADGLFLAAFYFYGSALLVRFRRPQFAAWRMVICLISYSVSLYGVIERQSVPIDFVANDFGCLTLLLFVLVQVWKKSAHLCDRLLLTIVTLIAMETFLRNVVLVLLLPAYGDLNTFLGTPYAFFMQSGAAILALLLGLSSLAAVAAELIDGYRDSAEQDPLTGLLNRRGFKRAADRLSAAASPRTALLVCDLDHFKQVNDTYGHHAGDAVLTLVADEIRRNLPPEGIAARVGGEEFVICLPGANLDAAALFANKLRLAVSRADLSHLGITTSVTASFGIADGGPEESEAHKQFAEADLALYAAKKAGRNRIMLAGDPPTEFGAIRLASTKAAVS
ncbi:GGDEF domain-containing protein [Affinirhizobium pseudoryzae]|uniref:GGDEF domain-containing protein n=1 Tax=Allorhizobium pseudoryzae TaxID=379684 RepID=UPI0013EB05EE|nr:GGDEF domain-containing protein [Allorhizobium pseudoryzae]